MTAILGPEGFQALTAVSDEVLAKLSIYASLLAKWQKKINLVGNSTMADPWRRHFLDSAQLYSFVPKNAETYIDLGSGAGFPGLVLAIMGLGPYILVDSDQRKGVFMREVIRQTGAPATVHSGRIEELEVPRPADIITSRACASVEKLLILSDKIRDQRTFCVFLKGSAVEDELTESVKKWKMDAAQTASLSDPGGVVLQLRSIARHQDRV